MPETFDRNTVSASGSGPHGQRIPGMLNRLSAGNIAGAMTAVTASMQNKYSAIFTTLQPDLRTIVAQRAACSGSR